MATHHSPYSILIASVAASVLSALDHHLDELVREDMERITSLVMEFLSNPISPADFLEFERALQEIVRELGRKVVEFACNEVEPEDPEDAPHDVQYESGGYRRVNQKTPKRCVDTTFGRITLWRRGYRYWHRDVSERTIFPLELVLGLTAGTTPALAEEISRKMAEDGATQRRVLRELQRQFGVSMSVGRLRDVVEGVATAMERFRQHYQVLKLLDLLKKAHNCEWRCRRGPISRDQGATPRFGRSR